MRIIILALLFIFPVVGYGQTAKYILDGNDDVKIGFFNSTNVSVISNAVFSNSSTFRNSLELGQTNFVNFRAVTVSSSAWNGITIDPELGIQFSIDSVSAAARTRTNLSLGWNVLTNTNPFFFRAGAEIGETNQVYFKQVTVGDGYLISNGLIGVSPSDTVKISSGGIFFESALPLEAGTLTPAANTTRTNLGLGSPWLTNNTREFFRRDVGLGATNAVRFSSILVDEGISYGSNNSVESASGVPGVFISKDGISFRDGLLPIGVLPATANTTRTNLGLGWSGLTNTNASGFQVALFNSSSLNAQGQRITNLAAPVNDNDAATRAYVFGLFSRVAPTVSFTNSVNTVEIGSQIISVSLGWSISPTNTPVASQTLTASQGTTSGASATNTRSATAFIPGPIGFPNAPFTTDTTWTLTVNDGTGLPGSTVTAQTSIAFRHYLSWGIASTTSLSNSQIQNLHTNTPAGAGREFRTVKGKSVSISGNGQYIYFAYPASFGAASFIVNNAPNTAWISNSVTYTNSSGNASQFLIYRSTDVQFGTSIPITIN